MKHLKLLIPILIALIIIAAAGTVYVLTQNKTFDLQKIDFQNCKVEVLEHAICGGAVLGELNVMDTKYFVDIISALEIKTEVQNYQVADGECDRQYLITLENGQKIYFAQGYGEAEGFLDASFVHINGKVYMVKNPSVLNELHLVKERFEFYDKLSGVAE